jgi:hypothetical protein
VAGTDLLFSRTPVATPGPVALVFGEDIAVVYEATLSAALPGPTFEALGTWLPFLIYEAELAAALPAPTFAARLVKPNDATLSATLPGLSFEALSTFASNTERPLVGHSAVRHQDADATTAGGAQRSGRGLGLPSGTETRHELAMPLPEGVAVAHEAGVGLQQGTGMRHTEADPLRAGMRHSHSTMLRGSRPSARTGHNEGVRLRASAMSSHQERYRDRRPAVGTRHTEADPLRASAVSGAGVGRPLGLRRRSRHQEAMRPPAGRYVPPGIVQPFDPCYLPNTALLFVDGPATDGTLLFRCDRHGPPPPVATLVIPIRSLYMLTNNIALTRVSDGASVPASAASVSLDVDSWTWGFSASVPGAARSLVDPGTGDPVDLLLTVNGMSFRVLVEGIESSRSYGRSDLNVRGRGRNAVLAGPYAAQRSFSAAGDRTAQQLAAEALEDNGVPLGWGLTWGIDDWLVPGGTWVKQGTHMDALLEIASAAGAYVQPHATLAEMLILPRYPSLPRDWGSVTPDVELPSSVVAVEGIKWENRPRYNRVFVAGAQGSGILTQATLASTAGDLVAPMVVHPLITHVDAGRQRARAELGPGGRQAFVTLRVPALSELGLVRPGKFVRYVDGATTRIGLVRNVQIETAFAESWQTLGVETHV